MFSSWYLHPSVPAPALSQKYGIGLLLPVMDLILVFVVAMVAGSGAHVRQGLAGHLDEMHKLVAANEAVPVGVDHI